MHIVFYGQYLKEGLLAHGHTLISLTLRQDISFDEQIREAHPCPDMVILELYGKTPIPNDIFSSKFTTVAYCIDSTINEFWLRHILPSFDYVFVDQILSIASLRRYGITANWLPLCTSEDSFRNSVPKKHFISFVGTINSERLKRSNLLHYIQKYFHINIVSNVTQDTMQDIFAQSTVTLNENLFDGVTLRMFQGLASGSLLLTEEGAGSRLLFADNEHLIYYQPHNIVKILKDIHANPELYSTITQKGQALCKELHTSKCRSKEMIDYIKNNKKNTRKKGYTALLSETKTKYLQTVRFGGSIKPIKNMLSYLIEQQGIEPKIRSKIYYFVGIINARGGYTEDAVKYFIEAKKTYPYPQALLQLAIIYTKYSPELAKKAIIESIQHLPKQCKKYPLILKKYEQSENLESNLLYIISKIYKECEKLMDLGFLKIKKESQPETALEIALLAWEKKPSPEIFTVLLESTLPYNATYNLLPLLKYSIENGFANDSQIALIIEIAEKNYDKELAYVLAKSLSSTYKQ